MQGIHAQTGLDSLLSRYAPGSQSQILTTTEGSGSLELKFTVIPPRSKWIPSFIGVIIDAAKSALSLDKPEVAALALFRRNLGEKFGQNGEKIANSLQGRRITVGTALSALRRAEAHVLVHQKYLAILEKNTQAGIPTTDATQKDAWEVADTHVRMLQKFQTLSAMKNYAESTPPGADAIDRNPRQFFTFDRNTGSSKITQPHARSVSSTAFDTQGKAQSLSPRISEKSNAPPPVNEKLLNEAKKLIENLTQTVKGDDSNYYSNMLKASPVLMDISRDNIYKINGKQLIVEKSIHGIADSGKFASDVRASLPPGEIGDQLFLAFCSLCNQDSLGTMYVGFVDRTNLNLMQKVNSKTLDPIAFEVSSAADGSWNFQCAILKQVAILADITAQEGGQTTLDRPGEMLQKLDFQVKFADGKAYIASIATDWILNRTDPAEGAA